MPIAEHQADTDVTLEDETPGMDDTAPNTEGMDASGDRSVQGRDPSEPEEAPRRV